MKIQTFSILAGGTVCNARCPFCVSKMTPAQGVTPRAQEPNERLFLKAARFAQLNGVTTAMITSKGEATLFPHNVSWFLDRLRPFDFPIVELQTNGSKLLELATRTSSDAPSYLEQWMHFGLVTVAISIVHWEEERNRQNYFPSRAQYIDLPATIAKLHEIGLRVRLTAVMIKDFIDTPEAVDGMIQFARDNKVQQLTFRPVNKPEKAEDQEVWDWTNKNHLTETQVIAINKHIHQKGSLLLELMHGGCVYDVDGQNVCTTHSLTHNPSSGELRQIIFFPDGTLRYDWTHPGAVIF